MNEIYKNGKTVTYPYPVDKMIDREHWESFCNTFNETLSDEIFYYFNIDEMYFFQISESPYTTKRWHIEIDGEDNHIASFNVDSFREFNDFMTALRIKFRLTDGKKITVRDTLSIYHWDIRTNPIDLTESVWDIRTNDCLGSLLINVSLQELFEEQLIYMDEDQLYNYLDSNMSYI